MKNIQPAVKIDLVATFERMLVGDAVSLIIGQVTEGQVRNRASQFAKANGMRLSVSVNNGVATVTRNE